MTFINAMFYDNADFTETHFAATATLAQVGWDGDVTRFTSATFGAEAYFDHSHLRSELAMDKAVFRATARFCNAKFENVTVLNGTGFEDEADFTGARFGPLHLAGTRFLGPATFTDADVTQLPDLTTTRFDRGVPDELATQDATVREF